jgi:hypothetical protein
MVDGFSVADFSPADGWPSQDLSIIAVDSQTAPMFPADVLPAPWMRWASDAAAGAGCPVDFVSCPLLAAVGGLIGNVRWGSPWTDWREPPVLNVALVGLPSSGKSPGLDCVTGLLEKIEAETNGDWDERRRAGETAKAEAKERRVLWEAEVKTAAQRKTPPPEIPHAAMEPEPPQRHRLMTNDPTIEKAARLSAVNPRGMILVRDELAGWLGGMGRYSSGSGGGGADRAFFLQAYGGRSWMPDRVKDGDAGVIVPHLTWSIIGGIQPDKVASLMMAGDDDGLTCRFLYVWPNRQKPTRPATQANHEVALGWLRRLRSIAWQPPHPLPVPFSPAAADLMQDWREDVAEMEDTAAGLFLSWLGKLPGTALRLATILTYLDWSCSSATELPREISVDAMARALRFLSAYAIPMARRTFGEAALPQNERDARRLARWLVAQRPPPTVLNARDLRRMKDGPGLPDAARTEAALEELAEAGWVRHAPARSAGHGKPRNDWAVNPAIGKAKNAVA